MGGSSRLVAAQRASCAIALIVIGGAGYGLSAFATGFSRSKTRATCW